MLQIFEECILPASYLLLSLLDRFDFVWEGIFSRRQPGHYTDIPPDSFSNCLRSSEILSFTHFIERR